MGEGNSKELVGQNSIAQIQVKYKELEAGFEGWLAKQSLPVEAVIVTITNSVKGAAVVDVMGTLTSHLLSIPPPWVAALSPQALASLQAVVVGPLFQARNVAVLTGFNAGIKCVMKRKRGKEDVQTSMVAAFGSGAMFSLVSGMGSPNLATKVVTYGLFFALVQGGLFKIGEKFSQPPVDGMSKV